MKKATFALILVGLLALGGQAYGELCAIDAVPAATLLLPYFEVDLATADGFNTLFEINNASEAATIAHVVFWTNWSAPTIDFDLFLTGYDVQSVDLRDVFTNFNLPRTAHERNDPVDAISPHQGDFAFNPHWDSGNGFASCDSFLPFSNPVIQSTARDRLINGHTGQPVASLGGACLGDDVGDDLAVGYITVDNASQCSLTLDPGEVGYFVNGGLGIANNINQLWGNYYYVDRANAFAQADTLVHIEANDEFTALNIPLLDPDTGATVANVGNATGYTFYGRYTQATGGNDNREPLGTTWAARYLNGGNFDQTDFIVWRDSTCDNLLPAGSLFCSGPDWFPLNEQEVIAFNEREDAVEICFFTGGVISPPDDDDPACFPYETGRYPTGVDPLDTPFNFGWMYLNLNIPSDSCTGDVDFPSDPGVAQSYVTVIHSAFGLFSAGLPAIELTDACQDANYLLANPTSIPPAPPQNDIPFF